MTSVGPPVSVLVAGSYGQGNTGDEAILGTLLRWLRATQPEVSVRVVSGDPAGTEGLHGVAAIHWGSWGAIADALRDSDLLVLGGGGIFFEYDRFEPRQLLEREAPDLAHFASLPLLAWMLGKPVRVLAAGVGPLASEAARQVTRIAFSLAVEATVRDEASRALLAEIGTDVDRIPVTADPAWAMRPAPAEEALARLADLGVDLNRPRIAIAARPWSDGIDPEEWQQSLAAAVADLARRGGYQVLLTAFHRHLDDAVSETLAKRLSDLGLHPGDLHRLPGGCHPELLASIIGRCDLLVGLRLHSVLFAILGGTPVVGIAYDPKVRHALAAVSHSDLAIDIHALDTLPALLARVERDRDVLGAGLRSAADALRRRAEGELDDLVRLIAARPAPNPLGSEDAAALAGLLAASLTARLGDLQKREQRVDRLDRQVHELWEGMGRYREWLRAQQALTARREAERDAAAEEVEELRRRLAAGAAEENALREELASLVRERKHGTSRDLENESLRQQRALLLAERNQLARRLDEIEATVAFKTVSRFWSVARRSLPRSGVRRWAYRTIRAAALRALRSTPAPRLSQPALEAAPPATPSPDFRRHLLEFEQHVTANGATSAVVIGSATQLLESEGQRPTQLALALSRRRIPVVFLYWRWWTTEWCEQDRIDEGIVQLPIDMVASDPDLLVSRFPALSRLMVLEFPHPSFFELLAAANAGGWISVYDVMDDWEEFHRVGQAGWFDEAFERHLIRSTDAVFAVNEYLAERVRGLGGSLVEVLGNGLKPGLDRVGAPRPLERGAVTVGYFGYLSGAWFDWQLVAEAARRRPDWRFYLIGYGGSPEGVELPANVAMLGKQPQSELAAFAVNWDVAIIPFKPERLAAGADPIKTYEYLAMGLPVVVTGVFPPAGSERLVTRTEGVEQFLEALGAAAEEPQSRRTERQSFAAASTWDRRLEQLLESARERRQRIAEKVRLIGLEQFRS